MIYYRICLHNHFQTKSQLSVTVYFNRFKWKMGSVVGIQRRSISNKKI